MIRDPFVVFSESRITSKKIEFIINVLVAAAEASDDLINMKTEINERMDNMIYNATKVKEALEKSNG